MMDKTFKELIEMLGKRFFLLVDKLFFSLKGVGFIVGTILFFLQIIPWYGWMLCWIGVVSWRMLERVIMKALETKANIEAGK